MKRMRLCDRRSTVGMALILALVSLERRGETQAPTHPQPPSSPPVSPRPSGAKPDPRAQRLCDALHALPAKRKSECCGITLDSLAPACAQELKASLRRGAVTLDAAAIDRCAARLSSHFGISLK